jgi:Mor family transcriptional regulator
MWQKSYEQQQHSNGKKHKLDADTVRSIRRDWETSPEQNRDSLGKKYRVSISTIDAVIKRKIWKDVV